MDFSRYKNRLKDYLHLKGIEVNAEGFCLCFVHSENTPSCKVDESHYHCFGCGADGDIYDGVSILEGITDRTKQFQFIENLFNGGAMPPPAPGGKKKERENFTADPAAQTKLENYLKENAAAEKEIIKFLNIRAAASSLGLCQKYPDDLIPAMVKNFYYWPGLDRARQDLGADVLRAAGIPLKNPNTDRSWWEHTGVILRLPRGYYKLHYYIDGECKKFNSKGKYPLPEITDKINPLIFTEGEMDAFSTAAIGVKNVFASGGTTAGITGPKVKECLLDVPEIILCFDADEVGRKASGLEAYSPTDKLKTNIPEIMRNAGYTGIIKIAELPLTDNHCEKDPEGLIIAGKRDVVIKAIQEAREYIPPEKKTNEKTPLKWDYLPVKRILAILKKITKKAIEEKEAGDVQLFISAILKAVKNPKDIEKDLIEWGATKEQIKEKNDVSPYILIEFSWKYGLSKYLQRTIKIELTPASELLKKINRHKPIVDIDFDDMKYNKNVRQFLETLGVRAAAMVVSDILDGHIIYVESEKKYYFFNGHTWRREPDMTGVIYNILIAVMIYYYEKIDLKELGLRKSDIDEIIVKMESRRFRVDIMSEFSQLEQFDVFKTSVLFDGPAVRETLTLIDGVLDFSGKEIIYRKSERDEYRRDVLPYTVQDMKKAINPKQFKEFMKGNFKNEKTLETLLFYLSLIPSRNTKYKYGGVFIGETNTGKTTTMDILQAVFAGMFAQVPAGILVSKGVRQVTGNEATPYVAKLEGKGCGVASEPGRNLYLNNALWKLLTGGDMLTARDLYQSPHDFVPTAQIVILTNHLPLFDSHDNATIQRMVIIPFLVEHKKGDKDFINIDEFKKKIIPEYTGIIKMFIDYYIKLKYELGGAIPLSDECKKYKQSYIEELDTDIDRFVKDCIKFDVADDAFVRVQEVYERYLKYYNFTSADSGKEALTRQKFTRYFKRDYKLVGYKQKKVQNVVDLYFFNIRLKPDEGITQEPRPDDTAAPVDYSPPKNYAPPPDENPFL
ncbi:toprim domain-containing protein [Treponema sp. R80B11-R83G3]